MWPQRGWDDDHAQIPFVIGGGILHGMRGGHESNVFHAVFDVRVHEKRVWGWLPLWILDVSLRHENEA